MNDRIPKPNIVNVITSHDKKFKLRVLAYRTLTPKELKFCLATYLQSRGLKNVPSSGEDEITTNIGFDGEQYRPFD